MPTHVQYPSSPALLSKCRALADAAKPGSAALRRCREDFRLTVAEDHYHMLVEGVDRYGKPRAALAKSTLDDPKRGPGPSLVPDFYRSRFVANVEVLWQGAGTASMVLVKRFRDVLSKPTKKSPPRPFAQYHLTGATKPGTAWVLPRRDVGGVTPKGFRRLAERLAKFTRDMTTFLKGRG